MRDIAAEAGQVLNAVCHVLKLDDVAYDVLLLLEEAFSLGSGQLTFTDLDFQTRLEQD